jgi:hypothetical protein
MADGPGHLGRAHEDSWKVAIMRDGLQHDADRCEMIDAIADRLRNQLDLKG